MTSGLDSSALEGLPVLKEMISHCKEKNSKLIIVPAGGINDRNLERILHGSGAVEFHASARSAQPSKMKFQKASVSMGGALKPAEFSISTADCTRVERLVAVANECLY